MATSYSNTGGSGNRTAYLGVTGNWTPPDGTFSNFVDGGFADSAADSTDFSVGHGASNEIRFDFTATGAKQIIDELIWYQSTTNTHGTWKWCGSQDGSTLVDILTGIALGGATKQTISVPNSTPFSYYHLVQTASTISVSPWLRETEFKIEQFIPGFVHSVAVYCGA